MLTCAAGELLFHDDFDDGDLANNDYEGWSAAAFGGSASEVDSAIRFDGRNNGVWHLFEVSSRDSFDVWNETGTTFQFHSGNAVVARNGVDGFGYRAQLGVLSNHEPRSGSGGGPDFNEANLHQNTGGGLYVDMFYAWQNGERDLAVSGNVFVTNKYKRPWSSDASEYGIAVPASFEILNYGGQADLVTSISLSSSGWEVSFNRELEVTSAVNGVEATVHTIRGGWLDENLGVGDGITNEFVDGAYPFAMGQNFAEGSGAYDLTSVSVCDGAAPIYPADELEPNNDPSDAYDLGTGDTVVDNLSINATGDEDWYRWTAAEDGLFSVDLYSDAELGDIDLELYSADGDWLDVSATYDDHEGILRQAQAGDTFLMRVTGFEDATHPSYKITTSTRPLTGETIYVAVGNEVRVFNSNGQQVHSISDPLFDTGSIGDVEVGPEGSVYVSVDVADNAGEDGKILHFSPGGVRLGEYSLPNDPYTRNAHYPFGFDVLDDGSFLVAQPNSQKVVRVNRQGKALETFDVSPAVPADVTVKSNGQIVIADDTNGESMLNGRPDGSFWVAERGADRTTLRDSGGTAITTHQGLRPIDAEENERGILYISEWTSIAPFAQGTLRAIAPDGSTVFSVPISGLPLGLAVSNGYKPTRPPASLVDTDSDSLPDIWELQGLDINFDGTIDLDLPAMGADPNHKDLFVEIDAMMGRVPTANAIQRVQNAFAAAPNSLVHNPDGTNGINLDVVIDEIGIPLDDFTLPGTPTDAQVEANAWLEFDTIKSVRFGTAAERTDANWTNIRSAKQRVFRYALFADNYAQSGSSGLAEIVGNDLLVTLGRFVTAGGTEDEQAATFMHELGHTLGLRHGGSDDINYKPNYHSVMNYHWQFPGSRGNVGWSLDYSRDTAATLDERNLDEAAGLGFAVGGIHDTANHAVFIGGPIELQQLVTEVGPVDFSGSDVNGDGNFRNDPGVARDLNGNFDQNYNGQIDAWEITPGETLIGFEDWSHLIFYISNNHSFADGVHQNSPQNEHTAPTPSSNVEPDPFESNDSIDVATDVGNDQLLDNLTLHQLGDEDWYRWSTDLLGTATFAVQPITDDMTLDMEVADVSGRQFAPTIAEDGSISVSVFAEPGQAYYLHILSPDHVGFYRLSVDTFLPFSIDDSLHPETDTLPGLRGEASRDVLRVAGPDGATDDIVANELIVHLEDAAELELLLDRYHGTLIATPQIPLPPPVNQWDIELSNEVQVGYDYLIRVDTSVADASNLESWFTSLEATGPMSFSSVGALQLMAIAAKEQVVNGLQVVPNFVGHLTSPNIVIFKSDESNGPGAPFNGFGLGQIQSSNLSVARAWQLFDLLALNRTSDLAVIDQGFALNADFPPAALIPMADLIDDDYDPLLRQGDESGKEWHGTGTLSTAAARMDNAFGSVGTGSQAVDPMLFHVGLSYWSIAAGLRTAAKWGADVINVSLSGECNFACGMFALFSGAGAVADAVREAQRAGATIVASADNSELNLDQTLVLPVELPGVIGVGAIDWANGNAVRTANFGWGSNYGSNVDIWAPGVNLTATPTPTTADSNSGFGGTSGAAPYIAGIVAMMKAIDPTLTPAQVQDILQVTANSSSDARVTTGYVNAYRALKETADRAGIQPIGDIYEVDDPGSTPTPLQTGAITRTIAPADWDVYLFQPDDYVDVTADVTYFDRLTPGNELQASFDNTSGTAVGSGRIDLGRSLVKPNDHLLNVWGTTQDSINAYEIRLSATPSMIAPDRFDDRLPVGEARNDNFAGRSVISDVVQANDTVAALTLDDLNFDTHVDVDFFEIQLDTPVDPATGRSECLASGDPRLNDPNTHQGSMKVFVQPDAGSRFTSRPFQIQLYNPDGTPLHPRAADVIQSALTYELFCPHQYYPDGRVIFAVEDPAGRNFYDVKVQYRRWDQEFFPKWFLEFEQPPFQQHIPAFADNVAIMYPSDPDVIDRYLQGELQELPAEYLSFSWLQDGQYQLSVTASNGRALLISLHDATGLLIAESQQFQAVDGEGDAITALVSVPNLPSGQYVLRVQGDSFGTRMVVNSAIPGDYNENHMVDAADYTVWKDTFGSTADLRADGNANGTIDAADYTIWK
ncbi:MAG: S8 family serine peptidase, partial [Planctomycetales bacterium]|nr:S8 family serine peptidase [Planctomycetales bacterium]